MLIGVNLLALFWTNLAETVHVQLHYVCSYLPNKWAQVAVFEECWKHIVGECIDVLYGEGLAVSCPADYIIVLWRLSKVNGYLENPFQFLNENGCSIAWAISPLFSNLLVHYNYRRRSRLRLLKVKIIYHGCLWHSFRCSENTSIGSLFLIVLHELSYSLIVSSSETLMANARNFLQFSAAFGKNFCMYGMTS